MKMTRREWLVAAGLMTAGGLLSGTGMAQEATPPAAAGGAEAGRSKPGRKRVLRIAHLTDIHVQPERKANEGMAACLRHVAAQKDKPELILTGGDLVMDAFDQDEARTKLQWEIFTKVLKDECGIPVKHTLGNHDIWGWNKKKSKTTGDEAKWGKKWACELLALERAYHSYDRAGWHIVHLDSVSPDGEGYCADLGEEQRDWLARDLAATPATTPVLIISHIPIVTICPAITEKPDPNLKDHKVSGGLMHRDARTLMRLFLKHRNVKVCLSGHLHLNERIEFNGVTYLCNGAVSGAWWKGRNQETDAGYAVVDLYDDGTFENNYVNYGWKAAT